MIGPGNSPGLFFQSLVPDSASPCGDWFGQRHWPWSGRHRHVATRLLAVEPPELLQQMLALNGAPRFFQLTQD
jgi:hypothetical protein